MILRVNPNRMELLRLRRRLALAHRGHKLLQDKLEEMMRRLGVLFADIAETKKEFASRTERVLRNLLYCRIVTCEKNFTQQLAEIRHKIVVAVSTARIMNIKTPLFSLKELETQKRYDFFQTSAQLDLVVKEAKEYLVCLLKLAQLTKTLEILSGEIEKTRRRVNALEYILIPSFSTTIRYIADRLSELERSNLMRLMRIKELIREH